MPPDVRDDVAPRGGDRGLHLGRHVHVDPGLEHLAGRSLQLGGHDVAQARDQGGVGPAPGEPDDGLCDVERWP